MAGLTQQGFERKRLPDILEELREAFRDEFGSINTGPESRFGRLIGIVAEREDSIWQLAEAVYQSQYPGTASGRSLDGVAALTGITRLEATRTTVPGVLIGQPTTTVPAGSEASVSQTGDVYQTVGDTDITTSSALVVTLSVTAEPSTLYEVTIDGTDYQFTSNGESADEIADEIASLVDADSTVDAESDGNEIEVISSDRSTSFSLSVSGPVTVESAGSVSQFIALESGAQAVPTGSLDTIETPVSGWEGVENFQDGEQGRDIETDAELRTRREQSLQILGAGTVEAIRARLIQNVDDVNSVSIVENRSNEVDADGRPPHSFETIVSGGTDSDVADELWQTKPAGIETFGTITEIVLDSQGNEQTIGFSRPENVYIWVRMTVNTNGVGTFPDDGEGQIKTNVVEYGETLGVGDPVVIQALFGPVYQVPGIADVTIEIAQTDSPAIEPDEGDWVTDNLILSAVEQSLWDEDRVDVDVN